VRKRVPSRELVFSGASSTRATFAALKSVGLDRGIPNGELPEGQIAVWSKRYHFRLMASAQVLPELDKLFAHARERGNLSGKPPCCPFFREQISATWAL
jgi:hypothetical protein